MRSATFAAAVVGFVLVACGQETADPGPLALTDLGTLTEDVELVAIGPVEFSRTVQGSTYTIERDMGQGWWGQMSSMSGIDRALLFPGPISRVSHSGLEYVLWAEPAGTSIELFGDSVWFVADPLGDALILLIEDTDGDGSATWVTDHGGPTTVPTSVDYWNVHFG